MAGIRRPAAPLIICRLEIKEGIVDILGVRFAVVRCSDITLKNSDAISFLQLLCSLVGIANESTEAGKVLLKLAGLFVLPAGGETNLLISVFPGSTPHTVA